MTFGEATGTAGSAELQEQLELRNRALAASAEGITIADARRPDNPLIYVNEGFERLTGYAAGEVLGKNCRFLQGAETDAETVEALRRAVREQREISVQLVNYRRDGSAFWNRLSITPVRDGAGEVTHFIGVQSDVTAEKEAREALRVANERLEAASREMRKDLLLAAELQRELLPVDLPRYAGWEFAYRFEPSSDVGGDSLQVVELDGRRVGLYILDVAGHGVAAALLSVTLTHLLLMGAERSYLYQRTGEEAEGYRIAGPEEVMAGLNRHFLANSGAGQYFTMVYGILDRETGEFRYVAAGHPAPVHVSREGTVRRGKTGGIPVGMLGDARYEEDRIVLEAGDRLYLWTDGITEEENGGREEFGVERLVGSLRGSAGEGLGESLQTVMRGVEEWSGGRERADDCSILAVERKG